LNGYHKVICFKFYTWNQIGGFEGRKRLRKTMYLKVSGVSQPVCQDFMRLKVFLYTCFVRNVW